MFKILTIVLLVTNLVVCEERSNKEIPQSTNNPRQKRLLFYDEEGNLVKTYTNPFLRDFSQVAEKVPFFGNFLNPLFGFLKPTTYNGATPYMIPVSEAVIQHINNDPFYQNKLTLLPAREQTIEPNALCDGKRVQIPSPRACNSFLNCWDGWAVEQECPDGLLFSSEGYCDYPRNVDCNMRALREKPKFEPQCRKDFEAFRSEVKCSEFFVCVNRLPIKFKCPADLAFNVELGICDYPNRVKCNASFNLSPAPPTQAHTEFETFPQPIADEILAAESPDPTPSSSPPAPIAPAPLAPTPDISSPSFAPGPDPSIIATYPAVISPDSNVMVSKSTGYNTQSWTSTHLALSRQDAIRQLQLGRIAKVNAA